MLLFWLTLQQKHLKYSSASLPSSVSVVLLFDHKVPAYYLGLGTILYGLLAASHPTILQLADAVAVRWIQQLSEKPSQKEVYYSLVSFTFQQISPGTFSNFGASWTDWCESSP